MEHSEENGEILCLHRLLEFRANHLQIACMIPGKGDDG